MREHLRYRLRPSLDDRVALILCSVRESLCQSDGGVSMGSTPSTGSGCSSTALIARRPVVAYMDPYTDKKV